MNLLALTVALSTFADNPVFPPPLILMTVESNGHVRVDMTEPELRAIPKDSPLYGYAQIALEILRLRKVCKK